MTAGSHLSRAVPVLATLDIAAAVGFYETRLGFRTDFTTDAYAGVCRDGVELHLWLCDDPAIPKATGCRVQVTGIDRLYEEFGRAGVVHPNGALAEKPWGTREFAILDGDGNLITFFQPA